jgi:hypothetical protein
MWFKEIVALMTTPGLSQRRKCEFKRSDPKDYQLIKYSKKKRIRKSK